MTVKVKFADFEQITRQRTLSRQVSEPTGILASAREILGEIAPFPKPIRLLGVSVAELEAPETEAQAEFDLVQHFSP